MIKMLKAAALASLVSGAIMCAALAQTVGGNVSLSVSGTSSNVQLPSQTGSNGTRYPLLMVVPAPGSTQEVFYALGGVSVAAVTSGPALPPEGICLSPGQNTYLAGITATSTATLRITQVTTCPMSAYGSGGGGGGGSVTQGTVPWIDGPTKGTGAYSAATIGASSAQVLAAGAAAVFLDIMNESTTATIACNFGGTAIINGAGSITIPPGWHRSWEGTFVPTEAVNCIASAASTPAAIGAK